MRGFQKCCAVLSHVVFIIDSVLVEKFTFTSGASLAVLFVLKIVFLVPESFQFMNLSEAKFYENYLTSDFHTNTAFQDVFAYPSGWLPKP